MEIGSGQVPARRVSREKDSGAAPPPPPPPRPRGNSRLNANLLDFEGEGSRKGSLDTIPAENGSTITAVVHDVKQGEDILADLNALQREVDALMKEANGS
jgi:hypothetical protein